VTGKPLLEASTTVDVSPPQARAWFLSLADHPERYVFDTHMGFTFTRGSFGEPGARFQTEERFRGLTQTLKFELTEVGDDRFSFVLRAPVPGVWGTFRLSRRADGTTDLSLTIGSDHRPARWLLGVPPVRSAVQTQIRREVAHIKHSMESIYQEETWAS
jgi:hypothetical protein